MRSSDSSEDGRGRVRAQTYPPRPSPRLSETNLQPDREGWLNNAMNGHRNSWPYPFKKKLGAGFGSGLFLHNKRSCGGGSIEGLGSSGSWSTKKFTRTSPTPTSCESGGSASSRSGTTPRGTPRALRRRYHRKGGWAEGTALPTTRQQRLVTSMFALVVILGSIQILALIVHPPGGGGFEVSSLSGIGRGGPGIAASVGGSGARRRVSGAFQDNFLRSPSAVVSNAAEAPAGGLRAGTFNNNEITQRQDQTLSLANPRAFEMVAADMGHLKNTVEKLDLAFRESMGHQAKDLAAMMEQLGLEPAATNKVRATPMDTRNSNNRGEEGRLVAGAGGTDNARQRTELQLKGQATGGRKANVASPPRPVPGSGGGDLRADASAGKMSEANRGNVVWNAYQRGKWVNGQWIPKVLPDDTIPDLSKLPPTSGAGRQRRVLLLSEKRSGGQAVGGILNADPGAFYVADPCRMGGGPEALDPGACSLAVLRLLACQPTINDVRNLFSFSYIVERSRVFSELESLRWQAGGTPDENDEEVRAAVSRQCRLSRLVVVKETRLAEVAPRLSAAELGVEFLHIVRDPRAAIHGMAEFWEKSSNNVERAMAEDCTATASRVCTLTENKLKDLTGMGKNRFRVLKYEMFVEAPFAMMKSVYNWLDMGQLPQEVEGTIKSMATQSQSEPSAAAGTITWRGSRTALGRFEWATRWAVEMPAFRRQQVQNACQNLLIALGYDEPDSPEEVGGWQGEDGGLESSFQEPSMASEASAAAAAAAAAPALFDGSAETKENGNRDGGGGRSESQSSTTTAGADDGRGKGWRASSPFSSSSSSSFAALGETEGSAAAVAAAKV